jgi:hypothetical protein
MARNRRDAGLFQGLAEGSGPSPDRLADFFDVHYIMARILKKKEEKRRAKIFRPAPLFFI